MGRHIYTEIDLSSCDLVEDCYGISDELLNWLKDSCIKTKSGDNLVCYHGSPSNERFAVFNDSACYGCESFLGFFSLDQEFAECYTYDEWQNSSRRRVRGFAINSKKLFDIKNPTCERFLKDHLPEALECSGDNIDKDSFIKYLKTGKLFTAKYNLNTSNFAEITMFERIGTEILGETGWEYSCSLARESGYDRHNTKYLHNQVYLSSDSMNNSVFVLDYYNRITPKIDFKYANKEIEGIRLTLLEVDFDTAVSTGIITSSHIDRLSHGKPVNIKLSAEEFIDNCSYGGYHWKLDRQKLKRILNNPSYSDIDFSVDVTLTPIKVDLNEFSQGLTGRGGYTIDNSSNTWKIYERSYCSINDQKVHILDWLKSKGFDAVVVKEEWAVNIICLYKNMIKAIENKKPTDSDNVYEKYNYSDALLAELD